MMNFAYQMSTIDGEIAFCVLRAQVGFHANPVDSLLFTGLVLVLLLHELFLRSNVNRTLFNLFRLKQSEKAIKIQRNANIDVMPLYLADIIDVKCAITGKDAYLITLECNLKCGTFSRRSLRLCN